MAGFTAVGFYLTSLVFGIIIYTLWSRIALRYFKISSLNAFSQLIYHVTDPLITPLNKLLQIKNQALATYDWVSFAVLILAEFCKFICLGLIAYHAWIPFSYVVLFVMADLIIQPCDILFYAILIRVIMSFANPGWRHPLADFLRIITEPLLIIGRKIVPDISGFDFSPFIIMMMLKVITLFISSYLPLRLL